jgi:hypothetical protein
VCVLVVLGHVPASKEFASFILKKRYHEGTTKKTKTKQKHSIIISEGWLHTQHSFFQNGRESDEKSSS